MQITSLAETQTDESIFEISLKKPTTSVSTSEWKCKAEWLRGPLLEDLCLYSVEVLTTVKSKVSSTVKK